MAREWFSSGFFDMAMADVLFDPKRMAQAKDEARNLQRLTGLKKGARILDAACGIGRHSLELARRGFSVTGVDLTPAYVSEASRVARREKLKNVSFEKGDLRDLYRFQDSFDLVINLFTSFGYYNSERANFEALSQMAAALRPGGSLVMELNPRESVHVNFKPKDWTAISDGYLMEKREWADGGRRLRNEWVIAIKGQLRELLWDIRLYSVPELKAMFKRAGLKNVKTCRDFQGSPWKMGHHLVILGEK